MNCPNCDGKTKVIESRRNREGLRRRRECLSCEMRLTTMETIIWEDAPGEPPGFQSTNFKDFSEKTQEDLANKMLKQKLLDLIAELD